MDGKELRLFDITNQFCEELYGKIILLFYCFIKTIYL
jgi:hypothetical protein